MVASTGSDRSCSSLLGCGLLFGRGLLRCWLGLGRTSRRLLLAHATRAGLLEHGRHLLDGRGSLLSLGCLGLGCSLSRSVGLGLRSSLRLGRRLGLGRLWCCGLLGGGGSGLRLGDLGFGLGLLLLYSVSDDQE